MLDSRACILHWNLSQRCSIRLMSEWVSDYFWQYSLRLWHIVSQLFGSWADIPVCNITEKPRWKRIDWTDCPEFPSLVVFSILFYFFGPIGVPRIKLCNITCATAVACTIGLLNELVGQLKEFSFFYNCRVVIWSAFAVLHFEFLACDLKISLWVNMKGTHFWIQCSENILHILNSVKLFDMQNDLSLFLSPSCELTSVKVFTQ